MFNSIKPDQNSQASLIQQCLTNYDYSNATTIAEDLLLEHDSEENKGLLADCYLSQQENIKAYFLLKICTSPANLYKLAVACVRLKKFAEAESALLRGGQVPNGVHGIELLGTIYKKQGKVQEARETYRKALLKNPNLLSTKKKLDKLSVGSNRFEVKNEVLKEEAASAERNLFFKPIVPVQNTTTGTGLFEKRVAADESLFGVAHGNKGIHEWPKQRNNNNELDILAEKYSSKLKQMEGEKNRNNLFGEGLPAFGSNPGTNNLGQWKSTAVQSDEQPSEEKSYEVVDFASVGNERKESSPIVVIEKEPPTKKKNKKSVEAVDMYFDEEDCEVLTGDDGKLYSKTLNFVNLRMNNNKFYIVQVLESIKNRGTYYFWTRWGRVGTQGQSNKVMVTNLQEAKKMFEQKVYDKTVKGDYIEIEMAYEEDDPEETVVVNEKKEESPILVIEKEPIEKKKNIKSVEAVDMYFDEEDCEVYTGDDGKFYSKRLNQSNITMNNNKFYIVQVLESIKNRGTYYFWTRWGRVGAQGQSKKVKAANLEEAIKMFEQKVHDKTGKGHYVEIVMGYGKGPAKTVVINEKKEADPMLVIEKEPATTTKKKKSLKGVKAVDTFFDEEDCEVYTGDDGKFYSKILHQANLMINNNMFYMVQVLESIKNRGTYYFWARYGRVGLQGQSEKVRTANLEEAAKMFDERVYDKTVKGDYRELEVDYGEQEEGPEETIENEKKSKLPREVQDLLKLIFNKKMMEGFSKQAGYDVQKMPLGKLSSSAIRKGYELLKEISDALERQRPRNVLTQYSADFYTVIPHDFGFQKMSNFIIDTQRKVKEKLELLATLENLRIAMPILSQASDSELNLLDAYYQKLNCTLTPCDKESEDFAVITEYMANTHAAKHSNFALEVLDVFSVERQGEAENYLGHLGNKKLLWFGARLNNYVGILSQGLKLPPAEAPDSGYMFGKGMYFADMVSKAAHYCFPFQGDGEEILLLCEVALGECDEKFEEDYNAANLPLDKHSVKGVGKSEPAANGSKIIAHEVVVPMGKPEINNNGKGCLLYNEYVVYDVNQIKIRYLVKVKFDSKLGF